MVSISAKEAAELVGMSKPGIIKAIRQGKISAEKDEKGEWRIEPVELFRVYTPLNNQKAGEYQPNTSSLQKNAPDDTASLQTELRLLRERLADKDDVIRDLRQRLDVEADERRKLTLILTDKLNTEDTPPPEQEKPKSWWRRILGGS